MKRIYFTLLFLAIIINGCTVSKKEEPTIPITKELLISKHNLKPIQVTEPLQELLDNLHVPYLKNDKYFLSDYKGNIVTSKAWDKIVLSNYPFYWGIKDDIYWLYSYPERLVIESGFQFTIAQKINLIPYFFKIVKETKDSIYYSFETDKIELITPKEYLNTENTLVPIMEDVKRIGNIIPTKNERFEKNNSTKCLNAVKVGETEIYEIRDSSNRSVIDGQYSKVTFSRGANIMLLGKGKKVGLLDCNGTWILPFETRKVKIKHPTGIGSHKIIFSLFEKGYTCDFNENLEIFREKPFRFIDKSEFDWDSIPENIRPDLNKTKRPILYQPYYVMTGKGYGHIFTCIGEYIASNKGHYDENSSLIGLPRERKYHYDYVPIAKFTHNKKEYYVRLSDGFEYRSK